MDGWVDDLIDWWIVERFFDGWINGWMDGHKDR